MGLVNPTALSFGVLYGVLILLYLWERHRRRVTVPSLLLWRAVPEQVIQTQRFRPDFLFLLQLVILTLLIGGLAGPYLSSDDAEAKGRRYIFILDRSASMQAREGRQTRFDQARSALHQRIAALRKNDEAMLIAVGNRPEVVTTLSRDHAALLRRLADLEALDTGTNLAPALAIAHAAAEHDERIAGIEVFTDLRPSQLDPQWRRNLKLSSVGETDDNLAIEGLQVFQGRFQDHHDASAHVVVRNFSHREAHGFLTVEVEDEVITRRGFSLPPRDARGFLVSEIPRPGILRARLEVNDALDADNRAYGWIRRSEPLRVAVVTDSADFRADLERIASAASSLNLRFVRPREYLEDPVEGADVYLLHHFVPEPEPRGAQLFIFPPPGTQAFEVRGEMGGVQLLDWNENHPVLKGLEPVVPQPIRHVAVLDLPKWAEPLLTSRSNAKDLVLAFAGERNGTRTACLAFDLPREHLLSSESTNWLLLFLNVLDWLAPSVDPVSIVRTGDVQLMENLPKLQRRVVDPEGRGQLHAADGALALEAVQAGIYQISVNGSRYRVLANLFDPEESDIGRSSELPPHIAAVTGKQAVRVPAGSTFSSWLYLLALLALLAEWTISTRTS